MKSRLELIIEDLNRQLAQSRRENKAIQQVVSNQQVILIDMENRLKEKPKTTGCERRHDQYEQSRFQQENQALKNALVAKQLEVYAVYLKLRKATDELAKAETDSVARQCAYLVDYMKAEYAEQQAANQRLQMQLKLAGQEGKVRSKELEDYARRITALTLLADEMKAKNVTHERENARMRSYISTLQQELKRRMDDAEEAETVKSDRAQLRAERDKMLRQRETLEQANAAQTNAIAKMQQRLSSLQAENERLGAYLTQSAANAELSSREEHRLAQLQAKAGELTSELALTKEKLEQSEKALKAEAKRVAALSTTCSTLEAQNKELCHQKEALESELHIAKDGSAGENYKLEYLAAKISQMEKNAKKQAEEIESKKQLVQTITRSNADLSDIIKLLEAWVKQVDDCVSRKEEMQVYIDFIDRGKQQVLEHKGSRHFAAVQSIFESLTNICNGLIM